MIGFSIIIPVYNVEQYLTQCVASVAAQKYSRFEVLLIDDGATDSSGTLCDALAAADRRIRVIHQANQGLSGARNTGIREAREDYLLFLDSDDWWADVNILADLAAQLECSSPQVLSFDYQKWYDGRLAAPYFSGKAAASGDLRTMTDGGLWVTGACNKAISRNLILENQLLFRRGITSEDIDWTLRLALAAERFAFVPRVVFLYRQRSGSISHSITKKAVVQLKDNVSRCLALWKEAPKEKQQALLPFIAYQYATLVHNYAGLPRADRAPDLKSAVREMAWLLENARDPKVLLMRRVKNLAGFGGLVLALGLRQRLRGN